MKTLLLGNNMHVMIQSLKGGDGLECSEHKVISGRKWVAVVVKNLMATLIPITKGVKIAQVVAANVEPQWK